jgi:hypothetical protein
MRTPPSTVQRVHFEDFGGTEFERLVFAYHVRAGWANIAWYGQTGSDQGRDIFGSEPLEDGGSRTTVIQCVNRSEITQKKATHDMQRATSAPNGHADSFRFVVRGNVSATRRDAIRAAGAVLGINHMTIWSGGHRVRAPRFRLPRTRRMGQHFGQAIEDTIAALNTGVWRMRDGTEIRRIPSVEFEEHLRLIGEDLLRRFCAGEAFPDATEELQKFADDFAGYSDADILRAMSAVFDRPAFRTPFREESSLPAFGQAIEDTIAALNTGVWRMRDGTEIRRIPSLHHLRDPRLKATVARVAQLTDQLRRVFVSRLRDGSIKHCSCGQEDCPVFMFSPQVTVEMDQVRHQALETFRSAHRDFDVSIC